MTLCYFAYGSNMLTKRLKKRCPGAVPIERAYADDWTVEFSKPSKDCSGKATLIRKTGSRTPGMLFKIPEAEVCCLDKYEGVGNGYERCDTFSVRLAEGDKIVQVATYIATRIKPDRNALRLVSCSRDRWRTRAHTGRRPSCDVASCGLQARPLL